MNFKQHPFLLSKYSWLWLTSTFLVITMTFVNVLTGHLLLAVLIVVFSIVAVVIRRPSLVFLLAPVFLLLIFKAQPLNTFGSLREQFTALMSKPEEYLENLFTPNSGTEVLPEEALLIHELVRQFDVSNYWLTDDLQEDNEIKEKIIESVWPVQIDSNSPYVFGYADEFSDRSDCMVIGSCQDIELGYCD